jgi:hypothetical protein
VHEERNNQSKKIGERKTEAPQRNKDTLIPNVVSREIVFVGRLELKTKFQMRC